MHTYDMHYMYCTYMNILIIIVQIRSLRTRNIYIAQCQDSADYSYTNFWAKSAWNICERSTMIGLSSA